MDFPELSFEACAACGVVFKTREVHALRSDDFYEAEYHEGKRSRRWAHRVRKAMRQLRSAMRVAPVGSVLDVGCSVGYIIEAGRRLGLRSAGADVSEFAVQRARERGLDARVGELTRLPFGDGEFDLVVLRHVLEHTAEPAKALAEVQRVLTPRGVALVVVPDVDYWKGRLLRRTYRYFRPDDLGRQHAVYFTAASLRRLLERTGFEVHATDKAVRRRHGRASVAERLGLAVMAVVTWLGRVLHLRRELYFVVQRRGEAARSAEA